MYVTVEIKEVIMFVFEKMNLLLKKKKKKKKKKKVSEKL